MTATSWNVSGQYFEACSCDYLCPCVPSNLSAEPTNVYCDVALVFHVERGSYNNVSLDDLSFVVMAHTPGVMSEGNWTVGLLIDDRASDEQTQALTAIGSGQAGGPAAGLAPLITNFGGVQKVPIRFESDGMNRSVQAGDAVNLQVHGYPSATAEGEPLYIDNVFHPANTRLALATAESGHMHAFGIDWDSTSGKTNGHFAPFNWSG